MSWKILITRRDWLQDTVELYGPDWALPLREPRMMNSERQQAERAQQEQAWYREHSARFGDA